MNKYFNIKNLHLIISAMIVTPVAFMYGLNPQRILPLVLNITVDTVDLKNVFRAMMFLYLGVSWIWVLGITRPGFWKFATLLNIVFMGSLALGRSLSFFADGWPSRLFLLGLIGEMTLAVFSIIQFKKYRM